MHLPPSCTKSRPHEGTRIILDIVAIRKKARRIVYKRAFGDLIRNGLLFVFVGVAFGFVSRMHQVLNRENIIQFGFGQ